MCTVIKMAPKRKHINSCVSLCDSTCIDKKMIISALKVKPDYTLGLEELTGPRKTPDDLLPVCGARRTLL